MDAVLECRKVIGAALRSIGVFKIKAVSCVEDFIVLQYSVLHIIEINAVPAVYDALISKQLPIPPASITVSLLPRRESFVEIEKVPS